MHRNEDGAGVGQINIIRAVRGDLDVVVVGGINRPTGPGFSRFAAMPAGNASIAIREFDDLEGIAQ